MPALMPSVRAIGPCTQSATQAVPVVVAMPRMLKSGSRMASAAASTTGSSRGQRAGDHALVGHGLGREVAEHRRQHAARFGAIGDAGDHGVEAPLRRRHQRQAVRQFGVGQDLLRGLPARRLSDDGPAAPLAHWMRVQATMVPPNDGMNAECLPGPPATVMCRSCGVRPMRR